MITPRGAPTCPPTSTNPPIFLAVHCWLRVVSLLLAHIIIFVQQQVLGLILLRLVVL